MVRGFRTVQLVCVNKIVIIGFTWFFVCLSNSSQLRGTNACHPMLASRGVHRYAGAEVREGKDCVVTLGGSVGKSDKQSVCVGEKYSIKRGAGNHVQSRQLGLYLPLRKVYLINVRMYTESIGGGQLDMFVGGSVGQAARR